MKVLLLEKQLVEANRLGALVREAGLQMTAAANETIARAALSDAGLSAALIAAQSGDEGLLTFVKDCRDANPRMLIAMLAGDLPEDYLARAYSFGLDFEVRTGSTALLLSRLRSLANLQRTATAAAPKPAAPKIAAGTDVLLRTAQSAAWRAIRTNMGNAAGTFLTLPATSSDVGADPPPLNYGTAISLGNVEEQLEIRIALGSDKQSALQLAMHLFGEGEDLVADMLGELGNVFMGTLKSTLSAESIPYTGGLPGAIEPELVLRPQVTYQHQSAFVLHLSEAKLVVHVGLRSKANSFVAPKSLAEGMVLAKDVFNMRGVMLVTAGTRLSASMVEKLRTNVDPKMKVEVMAP